MKIIKPMTMGVLQKPYQFRRQHHLVVAALGFFSLGVESDRFLPETLQWPRVLPELPPKAALDEVLPKAHPEVLLSGKAHAPAGKTVREMKVRLQLGSMNKSLRVSGDRQWRYGLLPWYQVSEAQPFTEMPLTYQRAWGGRQLKSNPVGVGYTGSALSGFVGRNEGPMPNIEYINERAIHHWRRYRPAGFGPIDITWAPRAERHGHYGGSWLAEDAPGLAFDTDFGSFNRAPEDQWIHGGLIGGESYRLEGLHPNQPAIEGCLPSYRVRACIQRKGIAAHDAEEVALGLDTVWFFPEVDLGLVVYRGQCPVVDSDALDVDALLIAYEQGNAIRSERHYHDVFALRTDSETAAVHAFNESQLSPPRSSQEIAERAARHAIAQAAELAERQVALEEVAAEIAKQSELPVNTITPQLNAAPPPLASISAEDLASGDFDLSSYIAQAKALAAKVRDEGDARLAEAKSQLANLLGDVASQPVDAVEMRQAAYERACQVASDLLPPEQRGPAAQGQEAMLKQNLEAAEQSGHAFKPGERKDIDQALQGLPQTRRRGRRFAQTPPESSQGLDSDSARWLGQQVIHWHQAGVCLAGRDLAGADLRGGNFTGADLREVMLERANLTGVSLRGANLTGAVLMGAQLIGVDLTGAILDDANLIECQAIEAQLQRSSMKRAMAARANFTGADLTETDLEGFLGEGVLLERAILDRCHLHRAYIAKASARGSRWQGADLNSTIALGADLQHADFANARLLKCVLMDAQMQHSQWQGARFESCYAGSKANWAGANLQRASATKCGWHGATMNGVDLRGAQLMACDFGECDLSGAVMDDALLSRSLFMRSVLIDCHAIGADFHQALCRKADFTRSCLRGSSFIQAELSEACFADADLQGASFDARRRAA